ncbi:MAG: protein TolQ [Pelagibacterales bacterium]|nr:protein TolQ [Pelagibacterales bacterium]OUU61419.1 MAG: protein TolQ [Alphaproteobacteria bacterium TMED62]|tara:strand:+ start:19130 stop:19834 length:705 start_codon:yes stop_codon:yes gene_type:complete
MNNDINIINDVDMSIWGLMLEADFIVRLVMLSLLFLSIFSWSIIFEKITKLRKLKKKSKQFEDDFWSGINIEKLHKSIENSPSHPMEAIFVTGMKELTATERKNINYDENIVLEKRIEKAMSSTLNREMEKLEKNLSFLATTGSSAPFIGLFGTVWGIMNSFQSIATSKNTSLAIVAPGIAEALLATAMGLLAAIPAVMAYNKISADTNRYYNSLEVFLYDLSNILSRHIHNKK